MDITTIAVLFGSLVFSYLLASFPSGVVVGKLLYGKDVRTMGSGGTGVTNVGRSLGYKAGLIVLILDLFKSTFGTFLAVLAINVWFINPPIPFGEWAIYLSGIGTAFGHCYPIFAQFKGGKAVSSLGGFIIVTNWLLIPLCLGLFLAIIKAKKFVSLGSILGGAFGVIASLLYWVPEWSIPGMWPYLSGGWGYTLTLLIIYALLVYRHKENIKRLLAGKENKVKW